MKSSAVVIAFAVLVFLTGVAGYIYFFGSPGVPPVAPPSESAMPLSENTYTHPVYGYSIDIPEGYRVDPQSEYNIQIVPDEEVMGVGPANFIYVSVVTPETRNSDLGTVYNYNPDQYQMLISLDEVGESVNLAANDVPEQAEWFEYTLVSVEDINGARVKNFENTNPWEFPRGTTENRFIYDTGENIYILGYYTGGEGVEAGSIDPRVAYQTIKSFRADN